jgi:DNA-binding FadR family transcriptional regulator
VNETRIQRVYDAVRSQIRRGDLPPGAPLLSEREMSATMGLSRNTVREAFRRLEAEGLVSAGGPGQARTVARPAEAPDPAAERARYEALVARAEDAERQYDAAVGEFMDYLLAHSTREAVKPWEICGNLDSFYEDEDTGEAWYRVQCQFPKGHSDDLGVRYHYDTGNEWSGGTEPEKATYPFRPDGP